MRDSLELDKSLETRRKVLARYSGRCIIHPARFADAVHEEPPRSINPNFTEDDCFPLCASCHEDVHAHRRDALERLQKARTDFPTHLIKVTYDADEP